MKYWTFCFVVVILISCKGEFASAKIKNSYESVMYVHDEVMPKMSDINKLQRKLESLGTRDNVVLNLLLQLEAADEGMMAWMEEFKLDRKAPIPDQLSYLEKEQIKIDKVSADMKTAIKDASDYFKPQ